MPQQVKRRKMKVKETDLVILRCEKLNSSVAEIGQSLSARTGALVLMLEHGVRIQTLPEEDKYQIYLKLKGQFEGAPTQASKPVLQPSKLVLPGSVAPPSRG